MLVYQRVVRGYTTIDASIPGGLGQSAERFTRILTLGGSTNLMSFV